MKSWNIDPLTGDYVMDGGQPEETNSLLVPAYFRLKAKRGRWMYAPDNQWGSDYYTVTKRPAENANQRLENIGLAALQPLVDDGRAASVDMDVTQNVRNGTELKTVIVDASGEVETQTFKGIG